MHSSQAMEQQKNKYKELRIFHIHLIKTEILRPLISGRASEVV